MRSRPVALLLGIAAALSIAFVISPFDATVRGDIGVGVLEETFSATKTGIAVGIATLVIDGLCAMFVALGLWANPSWSIKLERWMTRFLNPKKRRKHSPQHFREDDKSTGAGFATAASDLSLAFGVGAGAVLLKYPTAPIGTWAKLAIRYTAVNSVVFGIVGWMVAGGANWMADLGFGWLREGIIRWVPEPLVWTAIFFITVLGPFLYGEWLHKRGHTDETDSTLDLA